MSRRAGRGLKALRPWLAALAGVSSLGAAAPSCQSADIGTAGCQLSQEVDLPGTPLTLLPDARLDRVGPGFALSGVDEGGATVRWAALDAAGTLGPEHALAVTPSSPSPSTVPGPWLAFTAVTSPGDTLLVARAQAAANGTDAELHVVSVSAAGAPATAPAAGPALVTIPRALVAGAAPGVVFAASGSGAHAALSWFDPGAGGVELLTLSAAGQPLGAPAVLERAVSFDCLAFVPGKDAFTVAYYRYPDATSQVPTLVLTELLETGAVDGTLDLDLDSHAARCPTVTPTDAGYAIAFEDREGVWLGVYRAASQDLTITPFAAADGLGGADLLPPVEGLAPLGSDYGVIFRRTYGGELWRLDGQGHRRSGALVFPSVAGHIGRVSAQAGTGALFATYPDYSSLDAGVGTDGQRYFLGATCL